MYIYHALINALSAHMIHINLNMIFYTHVEHSPTKTIFIKYCMEQHTHAQTAMSSNMYDTDLYAQACARTQACAHKRTHTHTHTHNDSQKLGIDFSWGGNTVK